MSRLTLRMQQNILKGKDDSPRCNNDGGNMPEVDRKVSGSVVYIEDNKTGGEIAIKSVYGRTTLASMPGELVSAGANGSITLDVKSGEHSTQIVFPTPNGLPGIPVASNGNYIDEAGVEWLCDEIDYEAGTYTQRLTMRVFSGAADELWGKETCGRFRSVALAGHNYAIPANYDEVAKILCSAYKPTTSNQTYGKNEGVSVQYQNQAADSVAIQFYDAECAQMEVAEWRAKLAESPVTCLIALKTPIVRKLSDAELPSKELRVHVDSARVLIANAEHAFVDIEYTSVRGEQADASREMIDKYVHVPRLLLYGDPVGMTKENPVKMYYVYRGAENYINDPAGAGKRENGAIYSGCAQMKWQGSSSLAFPKKNYTMTLYRDGACSIKDLIKFRENWGAQSKYCLKANFIDPTMCRNVVAAKLWAKCVLSRPETSESYVRMRELPNAGAVDGYPVLVFVNNEYVGLYTLNIPKDEWMFGMADGHGTNAVLSGESWIPSVTFDVTDPAFKTPLFDGTDWDWEVKPENQTAVKQSFGKIYTALAMPETSNAEIASKKAALEACHDIYSAIDYGIFIRKMCLTDNSGKNQLMATYDGVIWILCAYDMDTAFGMHWSGASFYSAEMTVNGNNLTRTVERLYADEYAARENELAEVLSPAVICAEIDNFVIDIPSEATVLEGEMWPDMAGANAYGVGQIKNFMLIRCAE